VVRISAREINQIVRTRRLLILDSLRPELDYGVNSYIHKISLMFNRVPVDLHTYYRKSHESEHTKQDAEIFVDRSDWLLKVYSPADPSKNTPRQIALLHR
jgi:hypothetical protein